MKRQVAITGPTPEFLLWSIRQPCPLRTDIALHSVDQTEKRLHAVRVAGLAIAQHQVFEGIAVRQIQLRSKGFRMAEVFEVFGGLAKVKECCGECPANVLRDSATHGALAGCYGRLRRSENSLDLSELIESALTTDDRKTAHELFVLTNPVWYGLWASNCLQGNHLRFVTKIFHRILDVPDLFSDAREFASVLETCLKRNLILDVQLVPPGNSDGLRWTIAAHCERCKAEFDSNANCCQVCRKSGKGHPMIHRKVQGLRPWVDLAVVLGPQNVEAFLQRHRISQQDSD